jgi:hypothetical protein
MIQPEQQIRIRIAALESVVKQTASVERISYPIFNVKSFGAKGDGRTDDTAAIEACGAAIPSTGGIRYYPPGTYQVLVNPATRRAITLHPKVIECGAGADVSVVKLGPNQHNYIGIFCAADNTTDISDFAMYDLTVDSNASKNPVRHRDNLKAVNHEQNGRYSVFLRRGTNIRVAHCRFTDIQARNTLIFRSYNYGDVQQVWVVNNLIDEVGDLPGVEDGEQIDFDSSAIYTEAQGVHIRGNTLRARAPGLGGARTAIEIHGSNHLVEGNTIDAFLVALNVTGIQFYNGTNYPSENITISKNVCTRVIMGLRIYSWLGAGKGSPNDPMIANCTIADNEINIDRDAWAMYQEAAGQTVVTRPAGIRFEPPNVSKKYGQGAIHNLILQRNMVIFVPTRTSHPTDARASGFELRLPDTGVIHQNIQVIDNTVRNAPASGYKWSFSSKGSCLERNTAVDCGQSKAITDPHYRSGITLEQSHSGLQINDNVLVDSQLIPTMQRALSSTMTVCNGCSLRNNLRRIRGYTDILSEFLDMPSEKGRV